MNSIKKILIAYTADISSILVKGQVAFLTQKGYKVFILTSAGKLSKKLAAIENAVLVDVKMKRETHPLQDIVAFFKVLKVIWRIKPDVVNAGTPKASLLVLLSSWFLRVPKRIYTCRGLRFESESGLKKQLLKQIEKLNGYFAHKIICISPSLLNYSLEKKIFPASKVLVINKGSSNGIDLERFNREKIPGVSIDTLKNKLELDRDFVIGFVGRLHRDKGVIELIKAFELVRSSGIKSKLLLIGGLEHKLLLNCLETSNYKEDIVLTGFKEDVEKYMCLIDVLILPSHREGFGNVLIQAAALGIPVLASRVTGCKDAVAHGYNGFLFEKGDAHSMAQYIKEIVLSPHKRESLGSNGIKWAQNFKNEHIWIGLEKIYNS